MNAWAPKAVLFDLDDTLLRTDTSAFLERYFRALARFCSPWIAPEELQRCILEACERMARRDHPRETNAEAFCREFSALTGLSEADFWPAFERFYAEVYPSLRGQISPMPDARSAVLAAKEAGCQVAIATNPLFPERAVRARLQWADLADIDFDLITAMENMHYAKPQPQYYAEIASLLGVPTAECLMVGNDLEHDILPAAAAGMRTYLAHHGGQPLPEPCPCDGHGSLARLAAGLRNGNLFSWP